MSLAPPIEVVHADAGVWRDIERLFGSAGASSGCWCQYWILGADYHRRERTLNQHDLERQVRRGDAGLVAYRDGEPVGWARFGPRAELDWLLNRFSGYAFAADDAWSLSCFFVARRARGDGVTTKLIESATQWGRDHDTVIEGYPIDTAIDGATRNVFPGTLRTFLRAGFSEQGRLAKDRAVVVSDPIRSWSQRPRGCR
jgi:GNAT superfamily N-acetyltransferase